MWEHEGALMVQALIAYRNYRMRMSTWGTICGGVKTSALGRSRRSVVGDLIVDVAMDCTEGIRRGATHSDVPTRAYPVIRYVWAQ